MDKEIQKLEEAFKAKVGGQQDTPPPPLNGGPRTSPRQLPQCKYLGESLPTTPTK